MEGNMATEIESTGSITNSQCFDSQGTLKENGQQDDNHSDSSCGSQTNHQSQPRSKQRRRSSDIRVFKKSSANGKLTVYLGKRDFVDHIAYVDPIDGVVLIDRDYIKDKKVFGHVLATFSYGRDDLDVLGLTFRKELYLTNEQIFPDPHRPHFSERCPYYIKGVTEDVTIDPDSQAQGKRIRPLTRLQDRLVRKLGRDAFPFFFELPPLCPASVTLQPGPGDNSKPCGIDYELKAYIAKNLQEKPAKKDSIRLAIRKIMYAPSKQAEQPMVEVTKDFMMSPNKLNLEVSLDKELYHHGESIAVNVHVSNNSNRTVKKVKVSVRQIADICLFSTAQYKCTVAEIESEEGCPVGPGSTLSKVYYLCPTLADNKDKRGLALDGQLKHEDTNLASSTLLTDSSQKEKENLGIVVQYKVRVKLSLGPLGGDILAELPVTLMHPKPKGEVDNFDYYGGGGDKTQPLGINKANPDNPSRYPFEALFSRHTACKCYPKSKLDDQTDKDGDQESEQQSPNDKQENLIQLDDDNDIIFEDFARLKLDPNELSCSNQSSDGFQTYLNKDNNPLHLSDVHQQQSTKTSKHVQPLEPEQNYLP